MGLPPQKSKDFRGSLRRLFGHLRPEAPRVVLVILLAVVSVFFAVIGPKIMSNAINLIFEGAISKTLPAGVTQEQVIAGARAAGQDQFADMAAVDAPDARRRHRLRPARVDPPDARPAST